MIDERGAALSDGLSPEWVASTGLMRLAKGAADSRRLTLNNGNGIETVANENGILFLAFFWAVAHCAGVRVFSTPALHDEVEKTIESLRRIPYFGLFNRQPDDVQRSEAHDNYVGICALSVLWGLDYPKHICGYGVGRGWNFNNITPDLWAAWAQRQGGEIAFYQATAGFVPDAWYWIWLMVGLLLNAFVDKNKGRGQLAWLRLYALKQKRKVDKWPAWQKIPFDVVSFLWSWRAGSKFGTLSSYFYFSDEHPIKRMARECRNDGL